MRLAAWVLATMLLALVQPARAQPDPVDGDPPATKPSYRLVIDHVTHEPAAIGGTRLSLNVSALTLQGQRLDLDPKEVQTYVGSTKLDAPFALGTFDETTTPLAVAIVIQTTLDYGDVLPVIAETLDQALLAGLDEHTQLAVLPYGDTTGTDTLRPLKTSRAKLTQLAHDGTAGDPALLETIERALLLLRKAKTEPEGGTVRKVILVIGDGRDRDSDRERVTRLGVRAAKEGVRIHSFAYSPGDVRRPLLLLGELSRRSLGTFRWIQRGKADSWTPAFAQLLDELERQHILTYFLSAEQEPAGKKLKIVTVGRTETSSADRQPDLKIPDATCNGEACAGYCAASRCVIPRAAGGRGILGWLAMIVGIAVGAIFVLGLIGYAITKRQERRAAGPVPPGVPPGATTGAMPGVVPSIVPTHNVMSPASAPDPAVPSLAGRIMPHLMFLTGPRAGERIPLRHGFLIGKAPGCDLLIEDGYTSNHHAQIGMDTHGNCRLYDRGSTNGTFVNGVRVTELALEHGVNLRIGSIELRFLAQ